jgi:cytochrome P450/NADPH-cytochrome P450 reductase
MIQAAIRSTRAGFRPPDDSTIPLIMIGPGTGIAPFRGFLRQRAVLKAGGAKLGPAMLFFGCRHPERDYLYARELETFASQGIVELHVAFSRMGETKTYVQHLIAREAARVNELIDAGASIFVCGDGARMEPDVKRALMNARSGDAPAARRWMDAMSANGRYVLDVWAGS